MKYSDARPPAFTLTAGPVDAYPEVLRAMGATVLYDFDPAFLKYYETVALKAQKAIESSSVPVILHGEPVLGLEGAAASYWTLQQVRPATRATFDERTPTFADS